MTSYPTILNHHRHRSQYHYKEGDVREVPKISMSSLYIPLDTLLWCGRLSEIMLPKPGNEEDKRGSMSTVGRLRTPSVVSSHLVTQLHWLLTVTCCTLVRCIYLSSITSLLLTGRPSGMWQIVITWYEYQFKTINVYTEFEQSNQYREIKE